MEESFSYNWDAEIENSFLFDSPSELIDELLAFLDPMDSSLLPIDTCQNDMNSLISTSSLPPSTSPNCEDGCSFLPFPPIYDSEFFSVTPPPLSYNASSLHHQPKPPCSNSDSYIQEQLSPILEQCPLYYPNVDPTLFSDFEALPQPTLLVAAPIPNDGNKLSAQSVAARERRKRISEKTKELSRLIPSGYKMSTAEMLQAALKYVQFLQAQLGVLQLRDSIPGYKSAGEEHLSVLLASTAIQGSLSAEEMCIVPKEIMDEVAADQKHKSGPVITMSIDDFVDSLINMDYSE